MEKHSFPLQEEATEQTPYMDSAFSISHFVCNPSCYFVICKTKYFLRERCDLTSPLPSPVHSPSGEDGQKAARRIYSLLPESSCVVDKHRPKHFIKCGNIQTKRGMFSLLHQLHPEMNIPEQHTF